MPTPTMTEAEAAEAPALSATPKPIANPVINDDGIKAMAARFKQEYTPKKADTSGEPSLIQKASAIKDDPKPQTQPAAAPAAKPEAPVAKTEPAPDKADDPDIPPPDHAGMLTRTNWQKLHESRNSVRGQLEATKKQMEEAAAKAKTLEEELNKAKTNVPADIEELRKSHDAFVKLAEEHKKLEEQLETINLERSPRFQNWWKTETQKHLKLAERVVPPDKRDAMAKLLMETPSQERDAKLDEIVEALPNTSKRIVTNAMEQLETLKMQREEALTRGSENFNKLQEAERQERLLQEKRMAEVRDRLTNQALTKARAMSAFQPVQGDDAHNAEIQQREAFVRAAVEGKLDEDLAVMLPGAAVEYLHLAQHVIPAKDAEITKLRQTIKELQAAGPAPSSGGGGATKQAEPAKGNEFMNAALKLMRG